MRITRSIEIAADIEKVFGFHTDPANLLKITPPNIRVEILRHDPPGRGAVVVLRVKPFPLVTQTWEMCFDEFDAPRRMSDVQVRGPFKTWRQTREFASSPEGMVLTDTVDYTLPLGLLGALADALFVRRHIGAMFTHRQDTIKRLMEQQ